MKNSALKQTILSLLCNAAATIFIGVGTGKYIAGICFCTAVSIMAAVIRDRKTKEKQTAFH